MPVQLRSFAERIRSLLDEYVRYGNGNIVLEEFDPSPDSDAEDAAAMNSISGQTMPNGEKLYLGLSVSFLEKTVSIPFFSPHDESIIEYNITNAISEATSANLKKIGVITDLPVFGGGPRAFSRRGGANIPWIIIGELQKRFEIINMNNVEKIPDDLKALLIIHPKNISDNTLFAIDQYLMRGGRILLALDSYCLAESRNSPQAMMGQSPPPGSSNLKRLLESCGLEFSQNMVVADLGNSMRNLNMPETNESVFPTVLDIRNFENETGDPAISGIKHVNMVYAGAFTGNPATGLKLHKIILASKNSALIDSFSSELSGAQILREFKKDSKEKILAAKLSGKFKTIFPDGAPVAKENNSPDNKNEKSTTNNTEHLKESPETTIVLLSDVDMFSDEFCVSRQNFLGSTIVQPFNENLIFLQNIIEQLAGDPDLLQVRSRKIRQRPFTKIVNKLSEAQDKYQKEIVQLEKTREEAEAKINQIQRGKTGDKQFILSKEQKAEIDRYRKEASITAKKLKETRKELRKEIDKMQFNIQLINTAAVPLALVFIGIGIWLNGRRRRSR